LYRVARYDLTVTFTARRCGFGVRFLAVLVFFGFAVLLRFLAAVFLVRRPLSGSEV